MASLMMLFPEGKEKALTLSYDDGVEQDKKLIEILDQYGIKATFNLNSGCYAAEGTTYPKGTIHRRMSYNEVTKTYSNTGHEVAVHGLNHPWLEQIPEGLVAYEIAEDRKNLEQQFSTIVRGMAYPFGTYSDTVVDTIRSCGIVYSRTVNSSHNFNVPIDWLRLSPTCHHDDPNLMTLAKKFVEDSYQWNPYLFYVWGHSYEFEQKDNWHVIEEFASYIGKRDHIWYATNIETYDYMEAYRKLQFAYDLSRVKNPTAFTIWFKKDSKVFQVAPGETIELA